MHRHGRVVPDFETRDPEGRIVVLTEERWNQIVDPDGGHPEMAPCREEVLTAVTKPDTQLPGRAPGEEWFYLKSWGPSRWIKVVVLFEGGSGRILTAFPRRSKP